MILISSLLLSVSLHFLPCFLFSYSRTSLYNFFIFFPTLFISLRLIMLFLFLSIFLSFQHIFLRFLLHFFSIYSINLKGFQSSNALGDSTDVTIWPHRQAKEPIHTHIIPSFMIGTLLVFVSHLKKERKCLKKATHTHTQKKKEKKNGYY